ncbi:succinyl-diaminopimelate desuccinylase [Litorivicinus lipolyticus]|uniref:Succinyl-diaminopimelate desuccinylase n=1 Tax=Litorivicinus lipolyticus TaxID=418701 RepID=A0A5Q2QG21_9GAMM|nr:succinyl-diaminopimelate desuccinylase [Litorivicinus lipolyticus]QGG79955.1 succinyl-diaminopimelate desuccinylase [Litorivicinus lipolyticus]
MDTTVALAQALIQRPSVTPEDAGCLGIIGERLAALGFTLEYMDAGDTRNLWARRGTGQPLFAFAGHTDVVPTGPEADWTHPPFAGHLADGMLHGRGAADMKGSLAAMVTACETFLAQHPAPSIDLALLLTSDEEGPATHGTRHVMDVLQARGEAIDWCLVGEPSSKSTLGDIARRGRRGSLNCTLRVNGKQGHVAYPHLALNPIHDVVAGLTRLSTTEWDQGNDHFPATTLQISNIHSGTGVTNVIPGSCEVKFNFRFNTEQTPEGLKAKAEACFDGAVADLAFDWNLSGHAFLTDGGPLAGALQQACQDVLGVTPDINTGGGTSDGRFIAPTGTDVVELGPINATIHQVDECVCADDLARLSTTYARILELMCV